MIEILKNILIKTTSKSGFALLNKTYNAAKYIYQICIKNKLKRHAI